MHLAYREWPLAIFLKNDYYCENSKHEREIDLSEVIWGRIITEDLFNKTVLKILFKTCVVFIVQEPTTPGVISVTKVT